MVRFRVAVVALGMLLSAGPTAAQSGEGVVVGAIEAGSDFWHEIKDGLLAGLRHDPAYGGWLISVVPRDRPELSPDLVYYATPPYRGDNPRYLAPAYGHTAADVVDYSPREVRFFRTRADYERAQEAVRALLWPDPAYSKETARATLAEIEPRVGTLRLEITGARLAPTLDGRGRIDRLEFRIVVDPSR